MVYGTHPEYPGACMADRTFRDLDLTVTQSVRTLRQHAPEFDCIVVTGVSGLSVGAPVAMKLKKPLLVLRKEEEDTHDAPGNLLGAIDLEANPRVLFLDDLIASGDTLGRCRDAIDAMARVYGTKARVTHTYTYEVDRFRELEL